MGLSEAEINEMHRERECQRKMNLMNIMLDLAHVEGALKACAKFPETSYMAEYRDKVTSIRVRIEEMYNE
jgi:hypothetical protein